jgi:hypothetical protein
MINLKSGSIIAHNAPRPPARGIARFHRFQVKSLYGLAADMAAGVAGIAN